MYSRFFKQVDISRSLDSALSMKRKLESEESCFEDDVSDRVDIERVLTEKKYGV